MYVGVTIIVCLMPEKEVALFTPYREIASQYAAEEMREVEFISFPIPGEGVCASHKIVKLHSTL